MVIVVENCTKQHLHRVLKTLYNASQQHAPVAAAQPAYNSSSLPIITQAASATQLTSSVINKSKLQPVARIIKNNQDLLGKDGRVTTLALILAQECFFGEDVMIQCTPQGGSVKSGLPHAELMQFKEIQKTFPLCWNAPTALVQVFGLHWSGMQEA